MYHNSHREFRDLNNLPTLVTQAFLATLSKAYEELVVEGDPESGVVRLQFARMSSEEIANINLDIDFYIQNPSLPLENLCAHLDNYQPKNDSQQEMLFFAQKLIELKDDSIGAGLYMYGEAGIGKSHISIGMSKLFMKKGLTPNFIVADKYTFSHSIKLMPGQVWIIDDMNSGYHISSRLFKMVVLNAHDCGGRVFITSNKAYEELMSELFVGDSKANKIRYEDRTKGMFKIIHVTGESYRQAHAWYLE